MDYDHEINAVAGKVSALQVLLTRICANLAAEHPSLSDNIRAAFSEASNFVEDRAMQTGDKADPAFFRSGSKMIEELRAAVFGADRPV